MSTSEQKIPMFQCLVFQKEQKIPMSLDSVCSFPNAKRFPTFQPVFSFPKITKTPISLYLVFSFPEAKRIPTFQPVFSFPKIQLTHTEPRLCRIIEGKPLSCRSWIPLYFLLRPPEPETGFHPPQSPWQKNSSKTQTPIQNISWSCGRPRVP